MAKISITDAPASEQPDEQAAFDPTAWLTRFEAVGGTFSINEEGHVSLFLKYWGVPAEDQLVSAAMVRELTDDQLAAVKDARLAEAEAFDPVVWCLEFNHAGGSVYQYEGRPWTGIPEQEDDRALKMRNRLIHVEATKLRAFLIRELGLEASA